MSRMTRQKQFEALLQAHSGVVFKVAAIHTRRRADREDLAQEICIQAWRSFRRFDPDKGKFSTWLYRVALNVGISWARKHPWSIEDRHESLQAEHVQVIGSSGPDHETDSRITMLYQHIAGLNPLDRSLMLLYLDEHRHAEISEILGISTSNVATKINRIKQSLRRSMLPMQSTGETA